MGQLFSSSSNIDESYEVLLEEFSDDLQVLLQAQRSESTIVYIKNGSPDVKMLEQKLNCELSEFNCHEPSVYVDKIRQADRSTKICVSFSSASEFALKLNMTHIGLAESPMRLIKMYPDSVTKNVRMAILAIMEFLSDSVKSKAIPDKKDFSILFVLKSHGHFIFIVLKVNVSKEDAVAGQTTQSDFMVNYNFAHFMFNSF